MHFTAEGPRARRTAVHEARDMDMRQYRLGALSVSRRHKSQKALQPTKIATNVLDGKA